MKKSSGAFALIRALLCHACVILSLMYLVLFGIDRINTAMEFINNDITKIFLAVLAVLAIANAVISLSAQRRQALRAKKKRSGKTVK